MLDFFGEFAQSFLFRALSLIIIIPIHEFSHALTAYKLGDRTQKYQGRLTINPFAHLDLMGSIGILFLGIGWGKSVSVDARSFKNPKAGMAITAAAGPVSNIILAIVLQIIINILAMLPPSYALNVAITLLVNVVIVSIYLAVFNLIPVPPLDGSRILFSFLPQRMYFQIMRYEQFIMIGILVLAYSGVLGVIIRPVVSIIYSFVIGITSFISF